MKTVLWVCLHSLPPFCQVVQPFLSPVLVTFLSALLQLNPSHCHAFHSPAVFQAYYDMFQPLLSCGQSQSGGFQIVDVQMISLVLTKNKNNANTL